jgi:putative effector of murein hydrolase
MPINEIWVYLSGTPLLALFLTLAAYQAGLMIYERSGRNPVANPVAIAVAIVATAITLIDMPYARYFEGAQFVHFLLGTATVSLAVPIYRGLGGLGRRIVPLLVALVAGARPRSSAPSASRGCWAPTSRSSAACTRSR